MSPAAKIVLAVLALGVVLALVGVPFWAVVLVVVGLPVAGYLMLDQTQRSRLRRVSRKQIGS